MGKAKLVACEVNWGYGDGPRMAHVEVIPGVSIRISGIGDDRYEPIGPGVAPKVIVKPPFDRTFKLGVEVEYDSYNLKYTGPIVGIGAKTVTVCAKGTGDRTKRLNLRTFIWRNWDFNAEKAAAHNATEFMYI